MPAPRIEIIPSRQGARSDARTDLHVLVRITPPVPEVHFVRPPINLALVLDRSGSMAGGRKMEHALAAATFAVEQLLPTDRISVTIFDDQVETIVPSTAATDKAAIVARLRAATPRGSTALHDGWAAGARQVEAQRSADGLNRVLILSDGLANVGLTEPAAIAEQVAAARRRGVSTTTLGVGDDYNEDLMEAMARAGDGNYYFVESAVQLTDLFQTELHGLMATAGKAVELALEPRNGVEVARVLNELERTPEGRLRLPNLILGMPLEVVATLNVPPIAVVTELLRARLSWTEPGSAERQAAAGALIVPALPFARWNETPQDPAVAERLALLNVQTMKRQAEVAAASGDLATTQAILSRSRMAFECLPASSAVLAETEEIESLLRASDEGNVARLLKQSKFGRYRQSHSRPPVPPPPDRRDK